ncbi:conserved hypothetical protein [Ricinus communis]|uniref:Uncharacterized protein n=1 Tax=Ricinus communis TaxID=3988 RepID=B9SA72_RICCO|nr:conserved hypothetical protein [Ricinus communis]
MIRLQKGNHLHGLERPTTPLGPMGGYPWKRKKDSIIIMSALISSLACPIS